MGRKETLSLFIFFLNPYLIKNQRLAFLRSRFEILLNKNRIIRTIISTFAIFKPVIAEIKKLKIDEKFY